MPEEESTTMAEIIHTDKQIIELLRIHIEQLMRENVSLRKEGQQEREHHRGVVQFMIGVIESQKREINTLKAEE